MKKTLLTTAALLALTVGVASAAGLNLGWLDCAGLGGGALNRNNLCTSNSGGGHIIVGSFVAPAGLVRVTGFEATVDVQTQNANLSPWWEIGGCRLSNSIAFSADFTTGPFNCLDYWLGAAGGGGVVILPPASGGNNRIVIRAGFALQAGSGGIGPIAEGEEAYAFKATLNNSRSVGLGACAGCLDDACLVFTRILVTNEPGTPEGDFEMLSPADRAHITWQGSETILCPDATPAKKTSWGTIKSLYR